MFRLGQDSVLISTDVTSLGDLPRKTTVPPFNLALFVEIRERFHLSILARPQRFHFKSELLARNAVALFSSR